jgi:hypothetical protein
VAANESNDDPGQPKYIEAFTKVIEALKPLKVEARERIIRAACIILSVNIGGDDVRRR